IGQDARRLRGVGQLRRGFQVLRGDAVAFMRSVSMSTRITWPGPPMVPTSRVPGTPTSDCTVITSMPGRDIDGGEFPAAQRRDGRPGACDIERRLTDEVLRHQAARAGARRER